METASATVKEEPCQTANETVQQHHSQTTESSDEQIGMFLVQCVVFTCIVLLSTITIPLLSNFEIQST